MITFAKYKATARVSGEFYVNAINVMRGAEALSTYQSISDREKFRIEYWALEEAKLQRMPKPNSLMVAAIRASRCSPSSAYWSGRRPTLRRRCGSTTRPKRRPTCTRWAASRTRCSPATCSLEARRLSGRSFRHHGVALHPAVHRGKGWIDVIARTSRRSPTPTTRPRPAPVFPSPRRPGPRDSPVRPTTTSKPRSISTPP